MPTLNNGAILRGLGILWDANFIFAPAQRVWIYLVITTNLMLVVWPPELSSPSIVLLFAISLLLVPLTITTHRFLLTNEWPQYAAARLSPRFILASIQVCLPFIVPIVVVTSIVLLMFEPSPRYAAAFQTLVVWLALLLFNFFTTYFFVWGPMLTLPPLACGTALSRADAFAAVKGNLGRLTQLSFLVFSMVFTVSWIIAIAMEQIDILLKSFGLMLLGRLFYAVTTGLLDVATAFIAAGVLSLVYKALVLRDQRYLE